MTFGTCEREGCRAEDVAIFSLRGKKLCEFCWRSGMRLGRTLPLRVRRIAHEAFRIIDNGGSREAARKYFTFAQACINHGMEPPLVKRD